MKTLDEMIDARNDYLEKIKLAERVLKLSADETQKAIAAKDIALFKSFVQQLEFEIQAEVEKSD